MGKLDDIAARGRRRSAPAAPRVSRRNPVNDLAVTGDVEKDDAAESATVMGVLKESDEIVRKTIGNGYWLCLVFVSEDQRNEFVRKMGWGSFSDDDTYFDGLAVAEKLGVALAPESLPFRGQKPDASIIRQVGVIGDGR